MTKKVLLIDGNSVAFRAFFALSQQLDRFVNQEGLHTNAIYGFNNMLDNIVDAAQPDYALVAFDAGKTTFRTEMFSDYKGGRSKTPSELTEQIPFIKELVSAHGMTSYELPNYEADDIIGTLARQAETAGMVTTVVTGDRDLTQLASDSVTVSVTKKGVTEMELYTPDHVFAKFGIQPDQIIDMKGLMGDTSDNYPGVTKVGEKTALKLLKEYSTIENLYDHLDDLKPSKMKEHLIEDHDQALRAKQLATINREAPIQIGLEDLKYQGIQTERLIELYQQLNFKQALAKLGSADNAAEEETKLAAMHYTELTRENFQELDQLPSDVAFYLEMLDSNYHVSDFAGFVIGAGDQWLVSRDVDLLMDQPLKTLLEAPQVHMSVFNAKAMRVGLNRLGIHLQGVTFDLLLASYLLNTNENSNDLGTVAHEHGYGAVQTDEEVYGKGAKFAIPDDDNFFTHLTRKAVAIASLNHQLLAQLTENQQIELYQQIELPLSEVLSVMEIRGIHVNAQTLQNMGSKLLERLSELEQVIYQEAGEEFNINSPKQLGEILFEKLGLPVIKKTKTGYSTAVDVLEKLQGENQIVDNVLQYRQISKLQSTYIDGLLKMIHSTDQKVHTRYLQTLTQTGRLSSVDPNLQNIPIRLEEGRKIRQAFEPSHPGWEIFSSDYSQIELRVLAHITGDHNLQEAFLNDEDIHASTARRIFKLAPDAEIDRNLRRQAKAVNFGIVYGISDYGLSQNIGISRKQAKQFIETYFEEFPGVKKYIEEIVATAKKQGYVETLTHRRRYLPDINAKSFSLRSFAERTAMNTPIQGSAADIIKIAMINMEQAIVDAGLQARMLLQIHDELVFEAPSEEIERLEKLVPSVMDSAVKLDVPLKVESAHGQTWYEAK